MKKSSSIWKNLWILKKVHQIWKKIIKLDKSSQILKKFMQFGKVHQIFDIKFIQYENSSLNLKKSSSSLTEVHRNLSKGSSKMEKNLFAEKIMKKENFSNLEK